MSFFFKTGSKVGLFCRSFLFIVLILIAGTESSAATENKTILPQPPVDPVAGLWYTQDRDGGIEIYPCGDQICGRFYWLKDSEENGDLSHDARNPDPEKQSRPLCDMQFMSNFKPDGNGHYTGGTIYSPRHGANFSAEMTLVDHDTLHLRGYLVSPLLGQTQTWTRSDAATMPKCSAAHSPPAG